MENSVSSQDNTTTPKQNAVELMGKESGLPRLPRPQSARQLDDVHFNPNASELDSQTLIPTRAQTLPIELPTQNSSLATSNVAELFVPPENAVRPSSAFVAPKL